MSLTDRLPVRTLMVAAAALAVAAIPAMRDALLLRREAVLDGQVGLLFTGHLVHANTYHLLFDVVPLILLGFLFESALGRRYWMVLAASAVCVGLGVVALQPGLVSYCGLSGVLNGIWVAGALTAACSEVRAGRPGLALLYRACVVADLGKIAVEGITGTPVFTDEAQLGVAAVPLAHALGALGGAAVHALSRPRHVARIVPQDASA